MSAPSRILFSLFVLLMEFGCASPKPPADALARHPTRETRMWNAPTNGYTPSGVWRIRGERNMVYLGGTCHVLPADQVPFPSPFYAAYADSTDLYVEMDITDPSWFTNMRLTLHGLYWFMAHRDALLCPKGQTLADNLSRDTLARLKEMSGKDLRSSRISPFLLVAMGEGSAIGKELPAGVDSSFLLMAHRDHKRIRELDDGSISSTAFLIMDEMLAKYRHDVAEKGTDAVVREALLESSEEDHAGWRWGDLAATEREVAEMKIEAPVIYTRGLVERNRKWLPKLKAALHARHNVMVLVGADHVGGPDGLLRMLEQEGYKPEQMYGVDPRARAMAPESVSR